MSVQPLRTPDLRLTGHSQANPEPKVAVLLNANARKVTEKVIRSLSHVVPDEDLFISRSETDARRIAQTVIERRYHTVFCGGGDGTFVGFANEIFKQLETRNRYLRQQAPRFGVLKLGTGNGMAAVVNASSPSRDGILDDVLRARAGEVPGYRTLDLLQVDGKLTPFAGLGLDGKLLNDYIWVKNRFAQGPFKKVFSGGGGYFSSVAFKTVPYYFTHSTWVDCHVVNTSDACAYRIGADGQPTGAPIEPGATIFEGKLMMAAAGTIPYYGFKFTMFPFAGKKAGFMNLRLGAVSTASILGNLPKLWNGKWLPEGIRDFYAQDVSISFDRPMAMQLGGDAEGYKDSLRLQIAAEKVELVDFNGSVH